MDLIHPTSRGEVASALRDASADGRRVQLVGGRTHADRAGPREVDTELWTTQLDRTIAYDPAEMIAVVEAGMRVGEVQRILREGGQEWPVDAPRQATVGGVIAAGASSIRRLRVGHVRDTVVEMDLLTGDGRAVRSGARTVKNVTGFDVHRLATGSCGSLGAIVQVALKVRPLPQSRRTLVHTGEGGLELGEELLRAVPAAAPILVSSDRIELLLEGWAAEVEELAAAARAVTDELYALEDGSFPARPVDDGPVVVEVAVPPSRMGPLVEGRAEWTALIGVGLVWFRLGSWDATEFRLLTDRAEALGGTARVIRGAAPVREGVVGGRAANVEGTANGGADDGGADDGGAADGGAAAVRLPAPDVQRRLKEAFDPAGILPPIPGSAPA